MSAPTSEQLKQRRKKLILQMRAIDDTADPETGTLTPEQQSAFDDVKRALAELEIVLQRTQDMEGLERRSAGSPLEVRIGGGSRNVRINGRETTLPESFDGRILTTQSGERVPILDKRHSLASFASELRSEISFGGFLRALYLGPQNDMERRALAESSVGSGGALVPTPLSMQLIDLLRSNCVSFQAGAGTIPMESQTLRFARQIADPVGSWRAEGSAIAISNPLFDSPTLTAHNWALIVQVSRELLEDGQNIDSILQNIFAKNAALALDRAILYGTGTANQPLGIENTPGIQVVSMGVNGAEFTSRAPLLQAVQELQLANSYNCTAFVMSPRTNYSLAALTDTLGEPLRVPDSIASIPILTTTSASITETQGTATTASSIICGDFTQVMVGMRTSLQVTVLQERYADTGQVGFVLWMRADVLLQHPAALCQIQGILP